VQAGAEVSGLLGLLPSRVGYQPTLTSEVAALQCSTVRRTCVARVFLADDGRVQQHRRRSNEVDSRIHVLGGRELQDVISLLGVEEPGVDDRRVVARSRTSVASPSALADHLTAALYDRLGAHRVAGVILVHAVPTSSARLDIVTRSLLPFDFARFSASSNPKPSARHNRPRAPDRETRASNTSSRNCAKHQLSFAAGNEARMHAIVTARSNVHDALTRLTDGFCRLRQKEITAEIVELSAGSRAVERPSPHLGTDRG
jgi:hypothetical protein